MADDKKKGILSKLFGSKKSSCCNLKIEEVTDEQAMPQKTPEPSTNSPCCGPCCGGVPNKHQEQQKNQ